MGISVPNDAQMGRRLICRCIWRRGQRHIVMAQPDPADGICERHELVVGGALAVFCDGVRLRQPDHFPVLRHGQRLRMFRAEIVGAGLMGERQGAEHRRRLRIHIRECGDGCGFTRGSGTTTHERETNRDRARVAPCHAGETDMREESAARSLGLAHPRACEETGRDRIASRSACATPSPLCWRMTRWHWMTS